MNAETIVPLIASAAAAIYTVVAHAKTQKKLQSKEYMTDLEGRVRLLEADRNDVTVKLKECEDGRKFATESWLNERRDYESQIRDLLVSLAAHKQDGRRHADDANNE